MKWKKLCKRTSWVKKGGVTQSSPGKVMAISPVFRWVFLKEPQTLRHSGYNAKSIFPKAHNSLGLAHLKALFGRVCSSRPDDWDLQRTCKCVGGELKETKPIFSPCFVLRARSRSVVARSGEKTQRCDILLDLASCRKSSAFFSELVGKCSYPQKLRVQDPTQ